MSNIIVSDSLRLFAIENEPRKIFGEPARFGLGGKTTHVINVIKIGMKLCNENMNPILLYISLMLHDIGRSVQWKTLHNFSDRGVSHRYIALQIIEAYIKEKGIKVSKDWIVCTDVMQFHGVPEMTGFAHDFSVPYIEAVSIADDIENGCIGALGYLEYEIETDDKGYIKANPELDQKSLNPEVLEHFERAEKFDKTKLCHTYADYIVFAAMLAAHTCKKVGELAKTAMKTMCYQYKGSDGEIHLLDAVEGYCDLFRKYLHPDDAEKACEIIRKYCR